MAKKAFVNKQFGRRLCLWKSTPKQGFHNVSKQETQQEIENKKNIEGKTQFWFDYKAPS